jgi:hypothetical protein
LAAGHFSARIGNRCSLDAFEVGDHFPLFLELFHEHLPHQSAGLKNFGIGDAIVDIDPLPPAQDDPRGFQDTHVLGEIGLVDADLLALLAGGHLPVLQHVPNLQTLGVGKNFADVGL